MNSIKILMVEDDKDQQTLYEDAVEEYSETAHISMSLTIVSNAADAISELNSVNFDAVFLDLLLEGDASSGREASGNDVLSHIVNSSSMRPIVYILSGTLHSLSSSFNHIFENPLMRKFSRDNNTDEVLADLIKVLNTGVTKILGRSGKLEKLIDEIYFKHLAKGFDFWQSQGENMESALLRYTALHLVEYLDLPERDHDSTLESSYFSPEFYIYPPIKERISTGDVIKLDDKLYVLLTPACDISPRSIGGGIAYNVDTVTLAEIVRLDKSVFDANGIKYHISEATDGKWRNFEKNQRESQCKNRFHYVPNYIDIPESVIDFKRLKSIAMTEYLNDSKVVRIATISSPFLRDIQSRFSSYYGRQGQPNGVWAH